MARKTGAVNDGSVPISVFKERIEKHLHHTITNKQFALLYCGWVSRHRALSVGLVPSAYYKWLHKGYIPREYANHLMNYLITGEKI